MFWFYVRNLEKSIYNKIQPFRITVNRFDMKRNKIERAAGKLVAVVLAAMALSLTVFFMWGNNVVNLM